MKTRMLVAWMVAAVLVVPVLARADLTVKERTQVSGMMGMLSAKGEETTYIKGEKMRAESKTEMGGMMGGMMQGMAGETGQAPKIPEMVIITRLDKGVIWFVDNEDSTYTEIALKGQLPDSLGSGMTVKDVSVKKTGQTKEIIGYKCDGVQISMTMEITAMEGRERTTQTQTIQSLLWMRPEVKDLAELRHFWDSLAEVGKTYMQGNPMADAIASVLGKMKDIEGVPLGMEMTMETPLGGPGMDADQQAELKEAMKAMQKMMKGKGQEASEAPAAEGQGMKVTRYVTSVTRGSLSDTLFEIPKGYMKTQGSPGMFGNE